MSVRPNVQSLDLKGGELTVQGESTTIPLRGDLHVVVVQDGAARSRGRRRRARAVKDSVNWTAVLTDTAGFTDREPAETMGVRDPRRSRSRSPRGSRPCRSIDPARGGGPARAGRGAGRALRRARRAGPVPGGPDRDRRARRSVLDDKQGVQAEHTSRRASPTSGSSSTTTSRSTRRRSARRTGTRMRWSTSARRGSTSTRVYGRGPTCSPTCTTQDAPGRLLLRVGPVARPPAQRRGRRPDRRPAQRRERDRLAAAPALRALPQPASRTSSAASRRPRRVLLRHYHWIVLQRVPAEGPRRPVHGAARALHGPRAIRSSPSSSPERRSASATRWCARTTASSVRSRIDPVRHAVVLFPDLDGFRKLDPKRGIDWERFFALADAGPQTARRSTPGSPERCSRCRSTGEPALARRTLLRGDEARAPVGPGPRRTRSGSPPSTSTTCSWRRCGPSRCGTALARSTPLWYWILCEAEKAGGEHLGPARRADRRRGADAA